MILLNKTGEKTEEDQATDPRARRSRPGCGASSSGGATCNRAPPPDQPTTHPHFLPGMKFMYGNIRASITHVEYHDQQLEALPWRHFVGKCILAPATEAARWKYALERPFPFPAPFVSSRLPSPREPIVEPKPLESSSTTLQAFTTTNHLLPIYFLPYFSPRVTLALLSSSSSHLFLFLLLLMFYARAMTILRGGNRLLGEPGDENRSATVKTVFTFFSLCLS